MKRNIYIDSAMTTLRIVIAAICIAGAAILLGSCTRKVYIPTETVRTEYRQADTTQMYERIVALLQSRTDRTDRTDSLIDHRQQTVVLNTAGDTIRLTQTRYIRTASTREHELQKEVERLDSLNREMHTQMAIMQTDSIATPYPIERPLTKWQQVRLIIGDITLCTLAVAICITAALLIAKHKKQQWK